jgi:hypothetical protein
VSAEQDFELLQIEWIHRPKPYRLKSTHSALPTVQSTEFVNVVGVLAFARARLLIERMNVNKLGLLLAFATIPE